MNKNLFKISIFFIILSFSVGLISAEEMNNDELIVDNLNDEVIDERISISNDNGNYNFSWLENEINSKNIIDLEGKTVKWNENESYEDGITINKNVTIKNGVIDGNSGGIRGFISDKDGVRIFNVNFTGNLILENIELINSCARYGGAIYNNGNITLINCNLTGITDKFFAGDNGGAIINYGNGKIINSNFINNTQTVCLNSQRFGAAICNIGYLDIINSTFYNNRIVGDSFMAFTTEIGAYGGAIYNMGNINITNSNFDNNYISSNGYTAGWTVDFYALGGAIYNRGNATIINNNFTNNWVYGSDYSSHALYGGAIYNFGIIDILNSYFNENGNNALLGGAIFNFGTGAIFSSIFDKNIAKIGGDLYADNGTLNVSYSIFNIGKNLTYYPIAIYIGIINDGLELSNNFWGTNNPNFSEIIDEELFIENYYTIFLNIDSNAGLNIGDDLQYHINIFKNGTSDNEGSKYLPDFNITIKHQTNDVIIDNFNVKTAINSSSKSVVIQEPLENENFILAMYYPENNFLANNSYVVTRSNDTIRTNLKITSSNIRFGEEAIIIVDLICENGESLNTNIQLTVNGENKEITLNNGNGNLTLKDLKVDIYNIVAYFVGFDNYTSSSNSTTFTVSKVDPIFIIENIAFSENETLIITVNPNATGNVTVKLNGTMYISPILNGKVTITCLNLSIGNYSLDLFYDGDENFNGLNKTMNFSVQVGAILLGENIVLFYRNGTKYIVTLKDSSNNPLINKNLTVNINNAISTRMTDNNGQVSITINLSPGFYDAIVNFEGDNQFAPVEIRNTIDVKTTINGSNITKYFRNETQYSATLFDGQGKLLTNQWVIMNINGVMYNRTTDDNGVVRLSINLNPNNYTITVQHPDNEQLYSNTIKVLSMIEGKDITKYYKNGTQYSAKLYDDKGNVLANREVRMNINGVFYTRSTDSNGVVVLSINLNPETYVITVYHPDNDQMYSNSIKILSILTGEDLTKTFTESKAYELKLVNGTGTPIANENITINIHGVFYNRLTDDNGIAKLNINLNPGSYIATAYYGDYATSNSIIVNS